MHVRIKPEKNVRLLLTKHEDKSISIQTLFLFTPEKYLEIGSVGNVIRRTDNYVLVIYGVRLRNTSMTNLISFFVSKNREEFEDLMKAETVKIGFTKIE